VPAAHRLWETAGPACAPCSRTPRNAMRRNCSGAVCFYLSRIRTEFDGCNLSSPQRGGICDSIILHESAGRGEIRGSLGCTQGPKLGASFRQLRRGNASFRYRMADPSIIATFYRLRRGWPVQVSVQLRTRKPEFTSSLRLRTPCPGAFSTKRLVGQALRNVQVGTAVDV
jgi:hypothetical protein